MTDFFTNLFDTSDFPARWYCGNWSDAHGWTHVVSDLFTFAAYVAIPVVLGVFIHRRRDLPFPKIFWLFSAFIFSCGATHLVEAIIFWHPIYRVNAVLKSVTAVVSWATLIALVPTIRTALTLRSPAQLERMVRSRTVELSEKVIENERLIAEEQETRVKVSKLNDELHQKNREIEQFVYTVSHDLKAPLVTVNGFLGVMRDAIEAQDQAQAEDAMERVSRAATRMGELLSDLLKLSRSGFVALDIAEFRLSDVVTNAHLSSAEALGDAPVTINLDHVPALPIDHTRLQQVFENLLVNAAKYRDPHRTLEIHVGAESTDSEIRVFVRDNGIGVDPAHHERIFNIFERVVSDREGTGIGLAIVRRIVDLHGGRVWVESIAGEGATFWVALPTGRQNEGTLIAS